MREILLHIIVGGWIGLVETVVAVATKNHDSVGHVLELVYESDVGAHERPQHGDLNERHNGNHFVRGPEEKDYEGEKHANGEELRKGAVAE